MEKRKRLPEQERQAVLQKTNGHCAYCGIELGSTEFQVDHVVPLRLGGKDEMENMLPICRSCNHYKRGNSLEGWRRMLEQTPEVLRRDNYTYRQAVKFGLVTPTPKSVKFYFEQWAEQIGGRNATNISYEEEV